MLWFFFIFVQVERGKEYRREYKRRFAGIGAGRITAEEFYRWGEQARLRKADCEKGGGSADIRRRRR